MAHFRGQLSDEDIHLDLGSVAYSFTLQDALPSRASVNGARVHYTNVVPATDIEYGVTNVGLKETLRLRGRAAPSEFKYLIRGPASTTTVKPDGSIVVRDVLDRASFTIGAPWVVEARADPGTSPTPPLVPHASQSIRQTSAGLELTITLDGSWVRAPDRRFPLIVDPSVTVNTATPA